MGNVSAVKTPNADAMTSLNSLRKRRRKDIRDRIVTMDRLSDISLGTEQEELSLEVSGEEKEREVKCKCDDPDYEALNHQAASVDPKLYDFQFENLVFDGGMDSKRFAHCGAVKYLEEIGMIQQFTSFAGCSVGALTVALLVVGYTAAELEQLASESSTTFSEGLECCFGLRSFSKLARKYGLLSSEGLHKWLGDRLREKTGNADITFEEVSHQYGKIACIVVTNVSQMMTEYCHPKTTPDMPIRMAVRMSMSVPGLFSAVGYDQSGEEDIYVDGGVLCNYPIHCFDGWYLSMAKEDTFLQKMKNLDDIPRLLKHSECFGTISNKTMGLLVYNSLEKDLLTMHFSKRIGFETPPEPSPLTWKFSIREHQIERKNKAKVEYGQILQAVESFVEVLQRHCLDKEETISREKLSAIFGDDSVFPKHKVEALFGPDVTLQEVFELIDHEKSGLVRCDELLRFIEESAVWLQKTFFYGNQRKAIHSYDSFWLTFLKTLKSNTMRLYVEPHDLERTVGINTGHVTSEDRYVGKSDKTFLTKRGYHAMQSFLRYYTVLHPEMVKEKTLAKPAKMSSPADVATDNPALKPR